MQPAAAAMTIQVEVEVEVEVGRNDISTNFDVGV